MPETPTHMQQAAHGMAHVPSGHTGMQMSRPLDAAPPSVASLSRAVSKDGRSPSDVLAHQSSFGEARLAPMDSRLGAAPQEIDRELPPLPPPMADGTRQVLVTIPRPLTASSDTFDDGFAARQHHMAFSSPSASMCGSEIGPIQAEKHQFLGDIHI